MATASKTTGTPKIVTVTTSNNSDTINWLEISKRFKDLANQQKLEEIVNQIIEEGLMREYPDNYQRIREENKEQLNQIRRNLVAKYSRQFKQKSEKYSSHKYIENLTEEEKQAIRRAE